MTRGERVSVTNHMNKHKLRVKSFKQATQLEAGFIFEQGFWEDAALKATDDIHWFKKWDKVFE